MEHIALYIMINMWIYFGLFALLMSQFDVPVGHG